MTPDMVKKLAEYYATVQRIKLELRLLKPGPSTQYPNVIERRTTLEARCFEICETYRRLELEHLQSIATRQRERLPSAEAPIEKPGQKADDVV